MNDQYHNMITVMLKDGTTKEFRAPLHDHINSQAVKVKGELIVTFATYEGYEAAIGTISFPLANIRWWYARWEEQK